MVGVSGSGKSSYLKNNCKNYVICSQDDYFVKNGQYLWDGTKTGKAVEYCKNKFQQAINAKESFIAVDNQNLLEEHRKFYTDLATANGYDVRYVCIKCDNSRFLFERNAHSVPEETIERNIKKVQWPKSGNVLNLPDPAKGENGKNINKA